jgi:hypothetical protein
LNGTVGATPPLRLEESRSYTSITSRSYTSCTRSALSAILAEVHPAEVPEIIRAGLLGRVNALAMKPRRESCRPRRASDLSEV